MPAKIRVLQTIRQGRIGGGETHVFDLVQALDKSQFAPVVLAFTPGPLVDRLTELNIPVHVIETEVPFDVRCWGRVQRLLREERIDLVHAHGTRAQSNTFWAARRLGLPLLYTVHGWSFHPDQSPLHRRYRQLSEQLLMAQAAGTICVSDSNFQDGRAFSRMERATVIKNGIDPSRFQPAAEAGFRAELGVGPDTVLVGCVARLTAQKDPLTLIRAVAALPADLDVVVVLVGDGELRAPAEALARQLGMAKRVRFVGFRQDVPAVLRALDIYCLPSLWEGLPIGVLEAMACGRPVVATAVDGTRELLTHGHNGWLIPPADPAALAAALAHLAARPVLRAALGAQAAHTVQTGFSVQGMTRQVEQLYRRHAA
ncbi:glycosyltransferase family 4 protein [Hymenobacter yonginensis]|uniref:Glycosyltransferase family 4 protein n=1 Tax=Hymenobacter yonginensis TaxID=748197 RepID=A0ABY7PVY9_9BACT|nr:glycosyltransferase family 4 protein [Hymenobacter yonginensis]WBO86689.1 glycosyltransferase family 4 protein [Hymenobacter yonginensis]